jgi:hypothetical protein
LVKRISSGLALILVLALSGCDYGTFGGPAALQVSGSNVGIVVCRTLTMTSVKVDLTNEGQSTRVWEGTGEARVQWGQILSLGVPPDGIETTSLRAIDVSPGDELTVVLLASERPGVNGDVYASFSIPADGVPEGRWLQSNGDITRDQCAGWPE